MNASARPLAHRAYSLSNRLETQVYLYPQEKIYLHTDKPYYMAGDTIWLRAHVADASTLSPTALSKYVYVELRSAVKPASGEQPPAQQRIRLREREGVYAGYLPLPMTSESGDYTLTAYTAFMRNAGPDYFFRMPVYVSAYGSRPGEAPNGISICRSFTKAVIAGRTCRARILHGRQRCGLFASHRRDRGRGR